MIILLPDVATVGTYENVVDFRLPDLSMAIRTLMRAVGQRDAEAMCRELGIAVHRS